MISSEGKFRAVLTTKFAVLSTHQPQLLSPQTPENTWQNKRAHALQLLKGHRHWSLCATTREPMCHNYWACALQTRQATARGPACCNYWSQHALVPMCHNYWAYTPHQESTHCKWSCIMQQGSHMWQLRPNTAKKIKIKIKKKKTKNTLLENHWQVKVFCT